MHNSFGSISVYSSLSGFDRFTAMFDDDTDVFAEAGLNPDELEFMEAGRRRKVLEEAGLNPDEYDF